MTVQITPCFSVYPPLCLSNTHIHTCKHIYTHVQHTAAGQTSPREKKTSTTPRSPVRRWTPAPLRLPPSRLWARPRPLISAGLPVVLLQARGSRSRRRTGPGPTPPPGRARAGPVRSASQPPAASGRSTQSIYIRWVQQGFPWCLRSFGLLTATAFTLWQEKCVNAVVEC